MIQDVADILKIILIDIVLSGDNAVVIAMAAHRLPLHHRRQAILWGGGIAIGMRIAFTLVMSYLLVIPGLRLVGGLVLAWIACKLLLEEEEHKITPDNADESAWAAIKMIFIADFMMSLDNMLAVAGASHGNAVKLLFGLFVSIGIIMTCSGLIARLMNRFPILVFLGAAILALTAGEMILGDREVAGFIVRRFHVCLNQHWEHDYMQSHVHLDSFQPSELSDELAPLVECVTIAPTTWRRAGDDLTFTGRLTEEQRDALLACVSSSGDREQIEHLYEGTRERSIPDWVPNAIAGPVHGWAQRKWPADTWASLQGRHHHWLAWLFYAAVMIFCLTWPSWWRRRTSAAAASETSAE